MKRSQSKIALKNGSKGDEVDENVRESKHPPLQRRASARVQAIMQKAADELEVVEDKNEGSEMAKENKLHRKSRSEESVGEAEVVEVDVREVEVVEGSVYMENEVGVSAERSEPLSVDETIRLFNEHYLSHLQKKKKKPEVCAKLEVEDVGGKEDTENAVGVLAKKSDSVKVKETIRLFNKHYLHFIQEEETRCGKIQAERKEAKKVSKSKKGAPPEDLKSKAKRPDLKAMSKMNNNNEILYPVKRVGNIPGVEVGYQFYSRCEMVAVGMHSHWLNGIDCMFLHNKKKHNSYKFPVAVCIVLSGMYEDDVDNTEDIVYTGQGGHNLTGDKRQIVDQKLKLGNLALKNCVEQLVPVRVVRGHESSSSYSGKVYTYDGLYK
ncbi:histone-lysine N-methyltransferase, H3 lysine-9 specific SUVH4-like, partial [Gastrolobium bilobum]|uniref:histone-lysine N-methyltransferase, H3 lysine-9 specific SUVH4-like n=1 Tax=Gastrolobium bilobum TaxID=150636 RepID=UPI002AAF7AB3